MHFLLTWTDKSVSEFGMQEVGRDCFRFVVLPHTSTFGEGAAEPALGACDGHSRTRLRQAPGRGPVCRSWRAQLMCRHCHHSHGPPGHVEELHTATLLHSGNDVSFDNRPYVACQKAVAWEIYGEDSVLL